MYLFSSQLSCYALLFYLHFAGFVSLQREYFAKHPGGVNPVRANDVFFTVHAILLTFITILQCVFYDVSTKLLFV